MALRVEEDKKPKNIRVLKLKKLSFDVIQLKTNIFYYGENYGNNGLTYTGLNGLKEVP